MKKTIVTLLSLILILVNCVPCFAENQSAPPAGQISSNPNSAHYAWRNPVAVCADDELAFTYLECGIDLSGSSSVQITSTTETNILADYTIILTIQQWKNNKWNYYAERTYILPDLEMKYIVEAHKLIFCGHDG